MGFSTLPPPQARGRAGLSSSDAAGLRTSIGMKADGPGQVGVRGRTAQARVAIPTHLKSPPHPNPLPHASGRGNLIFIACLCIGLLLTACTTPEPLRLHGPSMGTTWQVTAITPA
ncbi:MAG: hypothetical protein WCY72_12070, partial [Lysobacteraceae bacterium]